MMYRWLFQRLPGPLWVRVAMTAIAASTAVWLLFEVVFPWVEPLFNEPTVP